MIRPLIRVEDGGARVFGATRLALTASVPLTLDDATLRAVFTLRAGEETGFALRWTSGEHRIAPAPTTAARVSVRIADTEAACGRPSTTSTTARTATSCA